MKIIMMQVHTHRMRKYIGASLAHLRGRVDALVFSAGLGENSPSFRRAALDGLEARTHS